MSRARFGDCSATDRPGATSRPRGGPWRGLTTVAVVRGQGSRQALAAVGRTVRRSIGRSSVQSSHPWISRPQCRFPMLRSPFGQKKTVRHRAHPATGGIVLRALGIHHPGRLGARPYQPASGRRLLISTSSVRQPTSLGRRPRALPRLSGRARRHVGMAHGAHKPQMYAGRRGGYPPPPPAPRPRHVPYTPPHVHSRLAPRTRARQAPIHPRGTRHTPLIEKTRGWEEPPRHSYSAGGRSQISHKNHGRCEVNIW